MIPLLLTFTLMAAVKPAHGAKVARFHSEASFRAAVATEDWQPWGQYIIALLDQLQTCGFQGQVVRLYEHPNAPVDTMGLYYLARTAEFKRSCLSGHWAGLDNADVRRQLKRLVDNGELVLFALQTQWPYHTMLVDPETSPFGTELRHFLSREAVAGHILFLGRNFLFPNIFDEGAAGYSIDFLRMIALTPAPLSIALTAAMARANRDELTPGIKREGHDTLPGTLYIRDRIRRRMQVYLRKSDFQFIRDSVEGVNLHFSVRRTLSSLLAEHLRPTDYQQVREILNAPDCSGLLH